ncbi:MAG: hypothetical protein QNJ54_08810 [Prochloraceae cyanobacterium]|nr:hypothetical protein [Prochloraceae cyanobacterium]
MLYTQAIFILKVLLISAMVSALIKYGGPSLAILPTQTNVLIGICLPTVLMALALSWRWKKTRQVKSISNSKEIYPS